MRFTEEQQAVIDARHQNILVSAAAGSGKPAVLTERILGLISGEDAVDIDRLLVVTFTRAAAAQMKEKISARISRALQENPQDEHLHRSRPLTHSVNPSSAVTSERLTWILLIVWWKKARSHCWSSRCFPSCWRRNMPCPIGRGRIPPPPTSFFARIIFRKEPRTRRWKKIS